MTMPYTLAFHGAPSPSAECWPANNPVVFLSHGVAVGMAIYAFTQTLPTNVGATIAVTLLMAVLFFFSVAGQVWVVGVGLLFAGSVFVVLLLLHRFVPIGHAEMAVTTGVITIYVLTSKAYWYRTRPSEVPKAPRRLVRRRTCRQVEADG